MIHTSAYGQKSGFTLIETMVAVAIISVALGGPFLAATRSYMITMDSKNRLVASYLAQEGIEYVRLLRENVFLVNMQAGVSNLSTTAFADFINTSISACTNGGGGGDGTKSCTLDSAGLHPCDSPKSCQQLYLVNGEYTLSGTTAQLSPFTRSLRFYDLAGTGTEVQVVSTVTWQVRGVTHKVELVSYLSPWQ